MLAERRVSAVDNKWNGRGFEQTSQHGFAISRGFQIDEDGDEFVATDP